MTEGDGLLEQALRELGEFARDPHRDRLVNKFTCQESRQFSEVLGGALHREPGYLRLPVRDASLPLPAGLVHPG